MSTQNELLEFKQRTKAAAKRLEVARAELSNLQTELSQRHAALEKGLSDSPRAAGEIVKSFQGFSAASEFYNAWIERLDHEAQGEAEAEAAFKTIHNLSD